MLPDLAILKTGFSCLCPRCRESKIFKSGLSLALKERCEKCGLDLTRNDSADGPAVFLIFILGALLAPLALIMETWLAPPLWVHAVVWSIVILGLTLVALKPLKAYIIALQYKHRPGDWS